ncbi:zinc finger, C3HC4 type domain-containing protein [Cryptosporidium muris RN66]|uniref:E3 ubiquitin protein ligase n=1 Tax=Cryptosporidium muris (strain RN66) TaxID=441375 RepID=B6AE17_CRYMR|nr:zinc finger, C3HC4 type domain-containing protein [Cryptosporidium muris RN66]EEA06458.1 zinc finger, C3HC4 type domain-containing protein [Cryptosporidium muris RN66]|eukprot:XP_002140807.1 zinc finger, C3HC4 type domain-containing protein [Cryptosporidium muris RN66]
MINKRKRDSIECRKSPKIVKNKEVTALPLDTEELSLYYVDQLQNTIKIYRDIIDKLNKDIDDLTNLDAESYNLEFIENLKEDKEIIKDDFEKSDVEGNNIDGNGKFRILIKRLHILLKKRSEESVVLENEIKRLKMQNVLYKTRYKNIDNTCESNIQSINNSNVNSEVFTPSKDNEVININKEDINVKLNIKDKIISDLQNKVIDSQNKLCEAYKKLSLLEPCGDYSNIDELLLSIEDNPQIMTLDQKNEIETSTILNNSEENDEYDTLNNLDHSYNFCKCVDIILVRVNELQEQLNNKESVLRDIIRSKVLNQINRSIELHEECEKKREALLNELNDLKNKNNELKLCIIDKDRLFRLMENKYKESENRLSSLKDCFNKSQLKSCNSCRGISKLCVDTTKDISDEYKDQLENIMNEYEELSSAFEEKLLECDELRSNLEQKQDELININTNIEELKSTIQEVNTVSLLYNEKLSLIRRQYQASVSPTIYSSNQINSYNIEVNNLIETMCKNLQEYLETTMNDDKYLENIKALETKILKYRIQMRKLILHIKYYKTENNKLIDEKKEISDINMKNQETMSILRSRIQYVVNKVRKLTNIVINIDETNDKDLDIDDHDKVVQELKNENKQLLTLMQCSVCHDKLKDIVIQRCGHLFCKDCIDKSFTSRNRKCPLCHTTYDKYDIKKIFFD